MSKTATPARPVRTQARQVPSRQQPLSSRTKKKEGGPIRPFQMPFEAKNIRIIVLGILVVGIGYLVMWMSPTMSDMALTVAPILLILGYCVIIPYGIMTGIRSKRSSTTPTETSTNGAA